MLRSNITNAAVDNCIAIEHRVASPSRADQSLCNQAIPPYPIPPPCNSSFLTCLWSTYYWTLLLLVSPGNLKRSLPTLQMLQSQLNLVIQVCPSLLLLLAVRTVTCLYHLLLPLVAIFLGLLLQLASIPNLHRISGALSTSSPLHRKLSQQNNLSASLRDKMSQTIAMVCLMTVMKDLSTTKTN